MGENREITNENKTVKDIPPGWLFVLFPLIFSLLGGLILSWSLVTLPIYYNYLRGSQSPFDQYVLEIFGSDLSRVVVLLFAVTGIIIGLILARLVTKKFAIVKREGVVILSTKFYIFSFFWWTCATIPDATITLVEMSLVGFYTSWFLRDIRFAIMSGYFVAFGVPILLNYFLLYRYANSIDSQVTVMTVQEGSGIIKPVRQTILKLVQSGPST